MTTFNLLPWRAQRRRAALRQSLAMLTAVCLLAMAMLAVCERHQRQRLQQQEQANASWEARLQMVDTSRQRASDARALLTDLARQQAELSALRASSTGMPALLGQLEAAMPAGLRLTELTFEQQRLHLSGQAPSGLLVAELMQALQALPEVGAVTLHDLQARGDTQVFRVSLDMRWSRS
ncbi:PilN domain-containing protein [Pseudomonas entomophila]|jgi:type IV pilus assembly protein PilN|uniref:PilN domain-containing protein n=1 Tax=Pseudomonas entomophila TaxID=312306 RepID=UPI0015E2DA46|nr:PilN domain-containing protein [Pseudomonas entomophila]MBA1194148.1 PilN domain-containing protein [Pseudomonas entomophila]